MIKTEFHIEPAVQSADRMPLEIIFPVMTVESLADAFVHGQISPAAEFPVTPEVGRSAQDPHARHQFGMKCGEDQGAGAAHAAPADNVA